jgi:hypothetical protein
MSRTSFAALALCVFLGALGCEAPGVGDPCEPETIPENGFQESEVYLETRSLQCRTRVCLVNHLQGDPSVSASCGSPDADPARCALYVSPAEVEDRVYCTCKCDGQDKDTIRCEECPEGFQCCPAFTIGPPGLRGSYCVRKGTCSDIEEED